MRVVSAKPAVSLTGKYQVAGGDQCAADHGLRHFMLPAQFPGNDVDGAEYSPIRFIGFLEKGVALPGRARFRFQFAGKKQGRLVNARDIDLLQTGMVSGRRPGDCAQGTGNNAYPLCCRPREQVFRLDDRLAAPDQFTGQPIMDKEPAKLAGLPYRLDGFAVFNKIKQ